MRRPFAASTDSVAWDPGTGHGIPSAQVTLWRSRTGTDQVTDLTDSDGVPLPGGIVVGDTVGVFDFLGPDDGTDQLWADAGRGRVLIRATDTEPRVGALETSVQAVGDQAAAAQSAVGTLTASKGQAGGLATLDASTGTVPAEQLPPGTGATRFVDLLDVNWAGAQDGQVATYDAASGTLVPAGVGPSVSVADLSAPYVIAHRGGRGLGPEHALPTYQQAVHYTPLIEQDVQLLPDGTLAVMHDTTVDRATNGTGSVIGYAPHAWKGLTLKASSLYHHNYPDIPGGVVTLDEVFARFGGQKTVFVIEVKPVSNAVACTSALVDLVRQYGYESRVIVQGWSTATLQPAIDAGLDTLYLWQASSTGVPSPAAMVAAGIRWTGISTDVADATIQTYTAQAGLKTVVWTLSKQWQAAKYTGLGAVGYFADDPAYLCGAVSRYQRTASNLGSGLPDVGMTIPGLGIAQHHTSLANLDIAAGAISNAPIDQVMKFQVTHGYLCPLPTSYTLTFDAKYVLGNGTTTRFSSVFLGTTDEDFTDGDSSTGARGYHILFRANGIVDIYPVTDNAAGTKLATGTSKTWAANTWETLTVTVSPTAISAKIGTGAAISTTDTTYRPLPYLTSCINTAPSYTTMQWWQRNFAIA